MTAPDKRPSWAEIDDAYRAHHGNPHYRPDSLPAKAAKDAEAERQEWIAEIERALGRMMHIMLVVTLVLAAVVALVTFAAAKVAEVQAMPRFAEGFE